MRRSARNATKCATKNATDAARTTTSQSVDAKDATVPKKVPANTAEVRDRLHWVHKRMVHNARAFLNVTASRSFWFPGPLKSVSTRSPVPSARR